MEKNPHKEKKNHSWIFVFIGVILILSAIALIILFLLNGSSKSIFGGSNVDVSDSLVCSSDEVSYPFFAYDNSKSKSMKINATFNDDKLDTIFLTYVLEYDDSEQADKSSTENHIALNKQFYDNSLNTDSFDAHFSAINNTMQMSLYAKAKEINDTSSKFFMLEDSNGSNKKELIVKSLNNHGLSCIVKQ